MKIKSKQGYDIVRENPSASLTVGVECGSAPLLCCHVVCCHVCVTEDQCAAQLGSTLPVGSRL